MLASSLDWLIDASTLLRKPNKISTIAAGGIGRMNRPILIGYQLLIGLSDTLTGALLILAPEFTLDVDARARSR